MLKIDAYAHILPQKYLEALYKKSSAKRDFGELVSRRAGLHDLETRFRIFDRHEGYRQILTIAEPPVEDVANPKVATELAKIANDEMAELVSRYPDMFLAAVACLPMNNMDAVLEEVDRAIVDLKFRGVQITTNIMDKPIDSPEFEPLFEKINYYNLPVLMHPRNMRSGPRAFNREEMAKDQVGLLAQGSFNWPFETTIAMGRIVYSGMLDKYPNLKILTHHCGGLAPYQPGRIPSKPLVTEVRRGLKSGQRFMEKPVDYYRMIYGDTACWGNTAVLMCGYAFFGVQHILFGTDMPFGAEGGEWFVRETIRSVEEMNIPQEDKKKIFEDNAKEFFRLPVAERSSTI